MGWHLQPEEDTTFQAHHHQGSQESGTKPQHGQAQGPQRPLWHQGAPMQQSMAQRHVSLDLGPLRYGTPEEVAASTAWLDLRPTAPTSTVSAPVAHTQEEAPVAQPREEAPQETLLERIRRLSRNGFTCGTGSPAASARTILFMFSFSGFTMSEKNGKFSDMFLIFFYD